MQSQGKLYIVGIGPGDVELLTIKAIKALKESEYVIGHKTYLERIKSLIEGKKIIESGMGREVERVKLAVQLAEKSVVSLVSGGDPSIYGILPLVVEFILKKDLNVDYEVIPGVTALCAASPLLGSPICGDHAVISLSDLLTPWEKIEKRLTHALKGDFVVAIYNPSSKRRKPNLIKAMEIVLNERGDVAVGIVKNAYREGCEVKIRKVSEIIKNPEIVDMNTILFITNSETLVNKNKMVTPRGYTSKYDF
uniref:Precorrin-3B C(17)-methyltransferase n=1 Tax=Geoglobus ahangari TaxID=113653 RepID=A0A7C4W2E8_9EURY